ncbi:MAG: hypothetical protein ACFFAQ_13950 [Promethearchaeota archaeon]
MDCFDEILDFYNHNINRSKSFSELWTVTYMIKLMNEFSINHNNSKAKNCLLFLLNLLMIDNPDHLHKKGKKIKDLTKKELKVLLKSLKSEFIS